MNKKVNKFNKIFTTTIEPGIILTNNEIKDIIKVNKLLQNRGILWKRTTEKKSRVKMEDSLVMPLVHFINESWFVINGKYTNDISWKYFDTFTINSSGVSNRFSYSMENSGVRTIALIISNEEMEDIMKTVKYLEEPGLLIN